MKASNVLLKYNPDMASKTALICNFQSSCFHPTMEQNIEPECVKPLHKKKTYLPFRVDVSGACRTCSEMLLGLELKEYKSTVITVDAQQVIRINKKQEDVPHTIADLKKIKWLCSNQLLPSISTMQRIRKSLTSVRIGPKGLNCFSPDSNAAETIPIAPLYEWKGVDSTKVIQKSTLSLKRDEQAAEANKEVKAKHPDAVHRIRSKEYGRLTDSFASFLQNARIPRPPKLFETFKPSVEDTKQPPAEFSTILRAKITAASRERHEAMLQQDCFTKVMFHASFGLFVEDLQKTITEKKAHHFLKKHHWGSFYAITKRFTPCNSCDNLQDLMVQANKVKSFCEGYIKRCHY